MGTHTIGNYLYSMGVSCRSGGVFTNTTIRHMLGRITYTGRIKCGEYISELSRNYRSSTTLPLPGPRSC